MVKEKSSFFFLLEKAEITSLGADALEEDAYSF
jgi:hypothetical protein